MSFDIQRSYALFDVLRPPDGYHVDHALFFTYSLDLVALVGAILALGGDNEKELDAGPLSLVEAFRAMRGRLHIVCQKGRVVVPRRRRDVLVMLDTMVHEAPYDERSGSWHPKLALVRYRRDDLGETFHRLWIGSRNLTASCDYEAGLLLVGGKPKRSLSREQREITRKIADMLADMLKAGKAETLTRRLDLDHVAWTAPEGTRLTGILWRGLKSAKWTLPRGKTALAFSPFLDDTGLALLAGTADTLSVVTTDCGLSAVRQKHPHIAFRRMEVPELDEDAANAQPDSQADDEFLGSQRHRGLHAKLILQQGQTDVLLIGSANLTKRGLLGPNAEILAQLEITDAHIRNSLTALAGRQMEADNSPPSEEVEARERLERLKRNCSALVEVVFRIEENDSGAIVLHATGKLDRFLDMHSLRVELFSLPGQAVEWPRGARSVVLTYGPLPQKSRTRFIQIEACQLDHPEIVHTWVQTAAEPALPGSSWNSDKRDDAALAAYIGGRRLREWLRAALDGVVPEETQTWDDRIRQGTAQASGSSSPVPFLLEQVLARWARNPAMFEEKFHEITRTLNAIAKEIAGIEDAEERAAAQKDLAEVRPLAGAIRKCIRRSADV